MLLCLVIRQELLEKLLNSHICIIFIKCFIKKSTTFTGNARRICLTKNRSPLCVIRAWDRHHLARWGRIRVKSIWRGLHVRYRLYPSPRFSHRYTRQGLTPDSVVPLRRSPSRPQPRGHGLAAFMGAICFRLSTDRRLGCSLSLCIFYLVFTSVHDVKDLFSFHLCGRCGSRTRCSSDAFQRIITEV